MVKSLQKVLQVLQKRGISYGLYLIWVIGFLRPAGHLLFQWPSSQLRRLSTILVATIAVIAEIFYLLRCGWWKTLRLTAILTGGLVATNYVISLTKMSRKARWARRQTTVFLAAGGPNRFTRWESYPVSAPTGTAIAELVEPGQLLVIGHIDNDGRVYSPYGPLPYVKNISKSEFVPRDRFPLDIVLLDDLVLVRKDFRGDRKRFLQEWYNLVALQEKCNVPAVYQVNEAQTLLYKNCIPGRTIRDIVVDVGARILTVQTENDAELASLDTESRLYAILARGLEKFPDCFSSGFIPAIEQQMNRAHSCGVANLSLTFGNIIVDEQEQPWLIDLESARSFSSVRSLPFRFRRDQDRQKFNRIYDQNILTEKSARTLLMAEVHELGGWYAPIDFGQGLTVGGFWSIESGTGRWEFINHSVMGPLIKGKRILDLGSNNGIMPLLMLRTGAKSVVGVELNPEFVRAAELVRDVFEWREMKTYDFEINRGNMTDITTIEGEKFDVVTALCTLYYLEPDEMARVVAQAAEVVPLMILQANSSTRSEAASNKANKSSAEFLRDILMENGFPDVTVVAPSGFSRPLLIGRRPF